MKKTLFLALALCCAMPVLAATEGQTLLHGSTTAIQNNTDWSFYVTFDSLGKTEGTAPVTLATVDMDPVGSAYYNALYAMGYTYGADSALNLAVATFANPSWQTISLGNYSVSASSPLSVAFSHAASNNLVTVTAGYLNDKNQLVTLGSYTTTVADKYGNTHLAQVDLGTNATATNIYNKSTKLTPATTGESGINIVSSRLNHEAYSAAHFEDFILEEAKWEGTSLTRYTAEEENVYEGTHGYTFNKGGEDGGEVSFNPAKFTDANNHTVTVSTAAAANIKLDTDTTFIVDEGNTVVFEGDIIGTGSLTKTGNGELKTRVNDFVDGNNETNKFYADVHVEEGTLHLYNADGSNPQRRMAYIGGVSVGGEGAGATVRVEEGALLILDAKTGICMPAGNGKTTEGIATTIDGGSNLYGEGMGKDYSWLSNVIITETSITSAEDAETVQEARENGVKLGEIFTHSFSLVDASAKYTTEVRDTTILANQAHLTGHVTIDNAIIQAAEVLVMTDLVDQQMSMKVQNHSQVILDNNAVPLSDNPDDFNGCSVWGVLENVQVDATSLVNARPNTNAKADPMTRIALMGENALHIKDADQGGLAVVSTEPCQHPDHHGEMITYETTQLSGCYLYDSGSGDFFPSDDDVRPANTSLNVMLDDILPNVDTYDHFTFTVVLVGLDSSEILTKYMKEHEIGELEDGVFYNLGQESPVHLTILQYMQDHGITMEDDIYIAHYNDYYSLNPGHQDLGPATAFRFSLIKEVPEPATATLSLLALAGICARRRRK